MTATTQAISLVLPSPVLASFDELAGEAGLSRPRMLAALVAEAEQRRAIERDAAILRETGGDPDPDLDAWTGRARAADFA